MRWQYCVLISCFITSIAMIVAGWAEYFGVPHEITLYTIATSIPIGIFTVLALSEKEYDLGVLVLLLWIALALVLGYFAHAHHVIAWRFR